MASSSALITLLVALGCAAAASAATFTVGDGQGWTTGADYATWASGKTFSVGDKLVFNYASQAHTVTEVTKSEYDACSSNANGENSGATTKTLKAGANYYICTIGTHCAAGMKLAVTAGDSSPGTPAAGTPPTTPSGSGGYRREAGPVLAATAGILLKLALF
ncbi:Blue copper protein [Hordeum vulgare]|uniref:Phytocyanin domain-containing protein n=1 Tax=Hordeum vulgare subsp. vulgare TaxID=112509 RepID=A0A8I6Y5L5_HORVV|nr:blue copper protein-like [Hordeum vulgare subsp. vulgare]KAE8787188.1 Blue copper protein [Hordeum vulgare]